MFMSLRRLRLSFSSLFLSNLRAAVANSVTPLSGGAWKKKNPYLFICKTFYRRLVIFAYRTLRNFVSEDLIKSTLNFEFRQMHFYLPWKGKQSCYHSRMLVFHFKAICRETNIIFAKASIVTCPEDRKIELLWGCRHTYTYKNLNCKEPKGSWLHFNFK